jgi:hypothetical protein
MVAPHGSTLSTIPKCHIFNDMALFFVDFGPEKKKARKWKDALDNFDGKSYIVRQA